MESSTEERCTTQIPGNVGNSLKVNSKPEAESHLQSLGFIMLNGKARFNLAEGTIYSNVTAATDLNAPDEEESFVILGKDSLNLIQASSLASYADIQQRSMSIDYNSMIASLNSNEIYQKVTELLQENTKLKETLKQNNVAMKQQFNTLATWQEEIMKIHQNHKKKFAETRELINYLKKENAELKMKISMDRNDSTDMVYNVINAPALENQPKETDSPSLATEYQERITSLTEELNNTKLQCEKLSADVVELQSVRNLMNAQLQQATSTIQEQRISMKKLEVSSMQNQLIGSSMSVTSSQDSAKSIESCTSDKNSSAKDKEINSLKQSINLLEDKLRNATITDETYEKILSDVKKYRHLQDCKIKQYNEQLEKIMKSTEAQTKHIATMKQSLKEILDTLINFTTCGTSNTRTEEPDYSLLSYALGDINLIYEKLSDCYETLIKEESKLQENMKLDTEDQNQFKLNLLDCNSILCQIETALEESIRTNTPCQFNEYCHRHNCNKVQWSKIHRKLITDFDTQKKCVDAIEICLKEVLHTFEINNLCDKSQAETNKVDCSWLSYIQDGNGQTHEKLCDCYKRLVVTQTELQKDDIHALNVHANFRKSCMDYDPILCYLSSIFHKYAKESSTNSSVACQTLQKTGNVQEPESNNKQSLLEEKLSLAREWEKLEEQKKQLKGQKEILELEYKTMETEKELLQQERINLHEEKTSLDRQSQLYEDHGKTLQVEKKMLEIKFDNLAIETIALRENLEKKECTIKELQKQIKQHMENVELLQTQLKFYEEDFKQERKVKEKLLEERSTLDEDLQKQLEYNEQLQTEVRRLKNKSEEPSAPWPQNENYDLAAPMISTFICPKCDFKFRSVATLNHHVQRCLNLD